MCFWCNLSVDVSDYYVLLRDTTSRQITFYVKGGLPKARAVLENFKLFALAESLGAVESLAESPAIMTHASVPPEHRAKVGITDGLIRLSVGIEGTPDIIKDLESALAAKPQGE